MIALSCGEVCLSFGTDVILQDISFAINDGDRLGIIGVNGAGKTSLFKIITGEYTPDSGAVYIQKGHTVGVLEQNAKLHTENFIEEWRKEDPLYLVFQVVWIIKQLAILH